MSQENLFTRFLLWCSGASRELLSELHELEKYKNINIGLTVFITSLLAFFTGGYALHSVFLATKLTNEMSTEELIISWGLVLLIASVWSLLIFGINRYILSTLVITESFLKNILFILLRILLAVSIAIVISHPLKLKVFEPEINEHLDKSLKNELEKIEEKYNTDKDKLVDAYNKELDSITNEYKSNAQSQKGKSEMLESRMKSAKSEYDRCRVPRKVRTKRGIKLIRNLCNNEKEIFDKQNAGYQKYQDVIINSLELNQALAEKRKERDEKLHDLEEQLKEDQDIKKKIFSKSLLSRTNTLSDLDTGHIGLSIFLLFLLVEILPILTRVIGGRSDYDLLIEKKSQVFKCMADNDLLIRKKFLSAQSVADMHELIEELLQKLKNALNNGSNLEPIFEVYKQQRYSDSLKLIPNKITDFVSSCIEQSCDKLFNLEQHHSPPPPTKKGGTGEEPPPTKDKGGTGEEPPPPPTKKGGTGEELPPPPTKDKGGTGEKLPPPPTEKGGTGEEPPPPPTKDKGGTGEELPPPPTKDNKEKRLYRAVLIIGAVVIFALVLFYSYNVDIKQIQALAVAFGAWAAYKNLLDICEKYGKPKTGEEKS